MKTFSIRQAIRHGWDLFLRHKTTLLGSALIILVLGAVKSNKFLDFFGTTSSIIITLALAVASAIVYIGWIKMCLKILDNEPVTVRELFMHSGLFFKYLGTVIMVILMVVVPVAVVGFIALMLSETAFLVLIALAGLVSLYLFVTYGFAIPIALDEHHSISESIKKSARITKGSKWRILGLAVFVAILNAIGGIVFIVGLLVTLPVTSIAYLWAYRHLLTQRV